MSTLKTYTADSFDEVNNSDAPRSFYQQLFALQDISIRLSRAPTLDDLYRVAVEGAIYHLGIDRLGILLIDHQQDLMLGTWGTDDKGVVRPEHDYVSPLEQEVRDVILELSTRGKVCVWHDKEIYEFSEEHKDTSVVIGRGWNAAIAIWDNDQVVGWIACDNFLTQAPFEIYFTYILRLFGQLVGELVLKKQAEEAVQALNTDLQQQNVLLQNTIAELNSTQQQLITAKIQASLKDVVVGVAHELNTPIGIATTALTSHQEQLVSLQQLMASQRLTKDGLRTGLEHLAQTAELSLANTRSAATLVREFKRLSVFDQVRNGQCERYALNDLVQQAIELCRIGQPAFHSLAIDLDIQPDLPQVLLSLEPMLQLLQDLLLNAFQHGELELADHRLTLRGFTQAQHLCLDITNSNKRIGDDIRDKIFEPFVTSGRGQGRVGLGLNVARNIATQVLQGQLELLDHERDTIFRLTLPLTATATQ